MIKLRGIMQKDFSEVKKMVQQSFAAGEHSDGNEHNLITRLRKENSYDHDLEVVAIDEDKDIIVGHGLLSKILIVDADKRARELCLAPLSVAVDYQRSGIGRSIVCELEGRALEKRYGAISILGDPAYYGNFGYVSSEKYQIYAPFEITAKFFLIKELRPNSLAGIKGIVEYPKALGI